MKKLLSIAIPVIVVVLIIFLMRGDRASQVSASPSPTPTPTSSATVLPAVNSQVQTITYTDSGFSPPTLNVASGTTVKFVNNSSLPVWPASAMHPSHKDYPGSDITKCGTAAEIFDACQGIIPGSSWSFILDIKGTWKYHDHLRVKHFGTIVVE